MLKSTRLENKKTVAVLKIRAKVLCAARDWLKRQSYIEVQGPTLIPALEEPQCSFEVRYFDKKAYLAQGLHPYGKAFVANLGKIYTIAPFFRAEKARTKRHLAEYWRIEVAQNSDFNDLIIAQEKLVTHICHYLLKEARTEIEFFNRVEDLEKVRLPFQRVTYDKAISLLQNDGLRVTWGTRFDGEMERPLSLRSEKPVFITEFPIDVQSMFFKPLSKHPELTLSADLLAPNGYGEVSSGGQMEDRRSLLVRRLTEAMIGRSDQRWYLMFMGRTVSPYSTFAIGLERLIQWICNLSDIRESLAFPRWRGNIYP